MRGLEIVRCRLLTVTLPLAIALGALAAMVAPAGAVPIKGKYGIGVDTGELLNSSGEAALIRGKSERTAWLLLVRANGGTENDDVSRTFIIPDSFAVNSHNSDGFSLSMGPGIRKFLRSSERLSPYFDVTLVGIRHVSTQGGSTSYSTRSSEWGVEGGLAFGVEYFFDKWPVSLSAHSDLGTLRYAHRVDTSSSSTTRERRVGDSFNLFEGLGPHLQVRVYF